MITNLLPGDFAPESMARRGGRRVAAGGITGLLLAVVVLAGCSGEEPIRSYRVPNLRAVYEANHVDAAAKAGGGRSASQQADRLLGAIVPHGERTVFFKMTGPAERLAAQEAAFRQLIGSLTFDEASQPSWELPADWSQESGSGQRLATLRVADGGGPLEVSVFSLATGDLQQSVLDNVNRWRGQMGLPPVAADQLDSVTERLEVAGSVATLVNVRGRFDAGGGNGSSLSGSLAEQRGAPSRRVQPSPLQYTLPAGWSEAEQDAFSRAAFTVEDGARAARITVSRLRGTGGGLLDNVNRWRGQVGLPAWTERQLQEQVDPLMVDGIEGAYVDVLPEETSTAGRAILGWVGVQADHSWFVKLMGDAGLARQQRAAFRSFLASLRFTASEGAGNGE